MPSYRAASSLALLLLMGMFSAQGASALASQSSPQQKPANSVPAPSSVEVINGSSRVIRSFPGSQSVSIPTPAANGARVEVMNGNAQRTEVLTSTSHPASSAAVERARLVKRHATKKAAAASPAPTAEIFNGTRRETRVFDRPSDSIQTAAAGERNLHPVVIGIASGASMAANGAAGPVVVGIASSSAGSATPVVVHVASSESAGGAGNAQPVVIGVESGGIVNSDGGSKPVAIGVSPRPAKRRPYRPAALDAQ
jgi:hypothetical protein